MTPRIDTLIGGMFSAHGAEPVDKTAVLLGDRWLPTHYSYPFQNADGDNFATVRDRLYWKGAWWICGSIKIGGTFYAFARRKDGETEWTGFRVEAGGDEGDGQRLYIADLGDGNGERLYAARSGGGYVPGVRALTYDFDTDAVTSHDIGWATYFSGVDPMIPWAMLAADLGDGMKLYIAGDCYISYPGGADDTIVSYDGTTITGISGPNANNDGTGQVIYDLTVHDFGDGVKRLVAVGRFRRVTTGGSPSTTNWLNVAAYDPVNDWVRIATGISLTGFTTLGACASFNNRLWVGVNVAETDTAPSTGPLKVFDGDLSTGAWRNAEDILKNLDPSSAGPLTRFPITGSVGTLQRAPIHALRVYEGRLIVGGGQTFRTQWRGIVAGGSLSWSDGTHGTPGTVYRSLPLLNGARPLCVYGGKLIVAVDGAGPDGTGISNICGWTDPDAIEKPGTLDSLGGGVNGTVYGACEFDGYLYVIGDFTLAGGVSVKGIARWDSGTETWGYVVNISDYGSPRNIAATSDRLIVTGTFDKVDGSSTYAYAVALDSSLTKYALFTSASYAAGAPTFRAVYVSNAGDYVYLGGLIDTIVHAGGTLSCHHIARMAVASWGTWSALLDDDAVAGHDGIQTGSVYVIGEQNGTILVGCEPTAKAGTNSTANLLWKWATSGDWTVVESALTGDTEPVNAITQNSDASVAWVTVSGRAVSSETFFPRARVRRYSGGTPTGAWVGRDANTSGEVNKGQSFLAQPTALVFGDAGAGDLLYIAGVAASPGTAATADLLLPSNLVSAITVDDRIEDVAGGLGGPVWLSDGVGRDVVTHVQRTVVGTVHQVEVLSIAGTPTDGTLTLSIFPIYPERGPIRTDTEDEVQSLSFTDSPSGTFKLTVKDKTGASLQTAAITYSGTVATLVSNINTALDAILGASAAVASGTVLTDIDITFSGTGYANIAQKMISIDATGMSAGMIAIRRKHIGGTIEAVATWDDTFATFLAAINTSLDDALGDKQIVATGSSITAITLTRRGHGQARYRHPPIVPTIDDLEGATGASVRITAHVPDALLTCGGRFKTMNRGGGQYLCGLDRHGVLVGVGGQLSGKNSLYFGPVDIKAVPRDEWPDEWSDPVVTHIANECEPYLPVALIGVGGFTNAINNAVRDADAGKIRQVEPAPGIFVRYADEFVDVGITTGPGDIDAVEVYDGVIVCHGIGGRPQYYDYGSGAWLDLEGATPYEGTTRALLRWSGKLFLAGGYSNDGGTIWYPLLEWNGSAMTPRSLPDFTNDVNVDLKCLTVADLGSGDELYAGGYGGVVGASFRGEVCPVVKSSDGASWSKVGSDSQFNGTVYGLAEIRYDDPDRDNILVAHGALWVYEGGDWVECAVAWWDGSIWHVGVTEEGTVPETSPIRDWRGRVTCDAGMGRVLIPTWATRVATDEASLGDPDAFEPNGIYVFRHPDDATAPEPMTGGGVNGVGGGAFCGAGTNAT